MGFLNKLTGGVDKQLIQNGIPGRGVILGVQPSGTSVQVGGGLVERACVFTVQVHLDQQQPYQAQCKQRVAEVYLTQFQPGATVVCVKVNPEKPEEIAIDFNTPPPVVRMARGEGQGSAAQILATGKPGEAVIVENVPLGMQNPDGIDMQAFTLTVIAADGTPPYQIQVGNPTPPSALPFLFPGSKVPIKIGDGPNDVVIDWNLAAGGAQAPAPPPDGAAPPPPPQQWGNAVPNDG